MLKRPNEIRSGVSFEFAEIERVFNAVFACGIMFARRRRDMMTAVKAYYNGTTFIPLQRYNFKPSQKVLIVVEETDDSETPAQKFMKLSWEGNESADEILETINRSRINSTRFEAENALFDASLFLRSTMMED